MESKKITQGLLVFYLVMLTWIILFKMNFTISELPTLRNVNLIPFKESLITNGKINFSEIINNILAFIPFGILIAVLCDKKSFLKKVFPIVLTSLIYEVFQFIFGIGASDITDVISNSLGGVIGIIVSIVISKIFKDNWKKIINVICLMFGIILMLFISVLILANL